jgi:DnaJ-domain-containing protein 1
VSIGRRFVDLIRSNVSSLFSSDGAKDGRPLEEMSDGDLERELARRRARRDQAERAASDATDARAAWDEVERAVREGSGRYRTSGRGGGYRRTGSTPGTGGAGAQRGRAATGADDPRLAQLYAQLECPYGSDIATVRKHYRALMLKYHPDMHSGKPEKQRIATELTQRLTMAYNELRRALAAPY